MNTTTGFVFVRPTHKVDEPYILMRFNMPERPAERILKAIIKMNTLPADTYNVVVKKTKIGYKLVTFESLTENNI